MVNIDDLKDKALLAKKAKEHAKRAEQGVKGTDMLFVLGIEQANTLENVLLDLLSDIPVTMDDVDKRNILTVIQYIQTVRD